MYAPVELKSLDRSMTAATLTFHYASDVNDAGGDLIAPYMPPPKTLGRSPCLLQTRERLPWREVINAILYLLHGGCPWQLLSKDFPPHSTAACGCVSIVDS
jgi:transposase